MYCSPRGVRHLKWKAAPWWETAASSTPARTPSQRRASASGVGSPAAGPRSGAGHERLRRHRAARPWGGRVRAARGRHPQGHRCARVRQRPVGGGHAPRRHDAEPVRVGQDPLDRYGARPRRSRRSRGAHRGSRPRQADLRPRVRRPAGARLRRHPVRGGAGRHRRRGGPRDRAACCGARRRAVRGPSSPRRHGGGAPPRRAEAAPLRQRAPPRAHRARRPRRGGRGVGGGILRDRHAGQRPARAGGRPGLPGRGRRRGPACEHAVAPRRSPPARGVPRHAGGEGPHHAWRHGRRLWVARGHPPPGTRLHAGPRHRTSGEDGVRQGGVVPGPQAPPSLEDLDAARRHPRRAARRRARATAHRRRGVRVVLGTRRRERDHVRRRPVRGAERGRRRHGGLHEQSALRRDARVRRAAGVLRARVPDGQARRRGWNLAGAGPPPQRPSPGIGPPHRSGGPGIGARARAAGRVGRDAGPGPAAYRGSRRHRVPGGRRQRRPGRGAHAWSGLRGRVQERRVQRGLRRRVRRAPSRSPQARTDRSRRSTPPPSSADRGCSPC